MATITADRAREMLDYNPDTGVLAWKKTFSNSAVAGSIAGCVSKKEGRSVIGLDKKRYRVHRIIYLIMTGEMPEEIDHINGNGLDNRWINLRAVTHAENMRNRKVCSNNTTKIMGVTWNKLNQNWRARIKRLDVIAELGSYDSFFEACCARKSAENKLGFHANHGRVSP